MALCDYSSLDLTLRVANINNGMALSFIDRSYEPLPEERLLVRCVRFELTRVLLRWCDSFLHNEVRELLVGRVS